MCHKLKKENGKEEEKMTQTMITFRKRNPSLSSVMYKSQFVGLGIVFQSYQIK